MSGDETVRDNGSEVEDLRAEVARLQAELAELRTANEEPTKAKPDLLADIREMLAKTEVDGARVRDELSQLGKTVEKRPLLSVLIALFLGLILGKLFGGD